MGYQEYNVLIIDDDKPFSESLKKAITKSGFRCYAVHQPSEALSYTKLQDVHVIIVDCMLPKMNGLEFVKNVRAHEASVNTEKPVKIIMITTEGYSSIITI